MEGGTILTLFGKQWCKFPAFIPETVNNSHIQMLVMNGQCLAVGPLFYDGFSECSMYGQ